MSNKTLYRKTLLSNLRDAVWGNQTIFKEQLTLPDPGTGHSPTIDYLDFGEHLMAIQVIAPAVRAVQFLVCEEYCQAIKTFERGDDYNRGACIMGQPGIGKSCFIAYAVIEMLRREQPVAVQVMPELFSESYALFSKDGVTLHPGDAQQPLALHPGIWAFSDSNVDVNIPALAFRTTLNVRVFQTTSPKVERWKWTKRNMISRYIMNVWSEEEITALATLLEYDVDRVNDLASKWGPVPYTLLQIYEVEQERSFESLMRSIASETVPRCGNILRSIMKLEAQVDPGPSSIFFIKSAEAQEASRAPLDIYVPSQTIAEMLSAVVCASTEEDRYEFFNAMIGSPGTRAAANFIFETWVRSFLSSGNTTLECNWHGKRTKQTLLPSANQVAYTDDELRLKAPPFYWRASRNYPGIDGALFHVKSKVYVIQMTISSQHRDPQPGLNELCKKLGKERVKKLDWKFLFIGHKARQSIAVSKEYIDKLFVKKSKAIRVGWCITGPLRADITVLKSLKEYFPLESTNE